MKHHYKAILLVLASEDVICRSIFRRIKEEWKPLYPFMRNIYESYMFEHPDIKVLFVYGADTSFERKEYDLVYDDIPEDYYPGMIAKTLRAMEHIDQTYNYDFLIRTNLSTFWDFNKLIARLDKLPTTKCLTGTPVSIKDPAGNLLEYVSGFDMVISRDLVKQIIPFSSDIINKKVWMDMEDYSLCLAIEKYADTVMNTFSIRNDAVAMSIDPFTETGYDVRIRFLQEKKLDHYRVKNRENRNIDKMILQRLLLEVYGKTL